MKIDVLTAFPKMFQGPFDESIIARAVKQEYLDLNIYDLRDWSSDNHRSVDDSPFGGGAGMVMRVDVIDRAVEDLKSKHRQKARVILLDTKGEIYRQNTAKTYATAEYLILIAGHYEGVDQRVHEYIADEVVSIGEFVLTGGELPAMVLIDSIVRLIPGVLGNSESLTEESYNQEGMVEYPQYTRPAEYKGWKVPEVLLSGNHKDINRWKKESGLFLGNSNGH